MRKITSFLIALFVLIIFTSSALAASDYMNQKVVTVASNEVIDKDFFVGAGDIVEIYGVVNGDVVVAGGQLLINGVINGDLLAAGGIISLSGEISQDVRIIGGQLTLSGNIGRNLTAVGSNIEVTESAEITGGAIFAGGNVTVEAPIGGEMYVGAGNLTLSNQVAGDVQALVGTLRLTSNAKIDGDFTYYSDEGALIDENATISGKLTKRERSSELEAFRGKGASEFERGLKNSSRFIGFFTAAVFGLVMLRLFPNYTKGVAFTVREKLLKSLAVGMVALVLMPILAVILMVTVIGLPFGLILIFFYFVYMFIAKIFISICIGEYLYERLNREKTQYLPFMLGLVIYSALVWIPYVGGLTKFAVLLLGLGAAVLHYREFHAKAVKLKVI
jgi:hypothetical protein